MGQCSENLSEEAVCAAWEGSRVAQQGEVAWVAALNLASHSQTLTEPFPVIEHADLVGEQQNDPVIGKILELKRRDTEMTEDRRRALDKPTRKLSREWNKLHIENDLLYRKTLGR